MRNLISFALLLFAAVYTNAQTPLFIPDTLAGTNINLNIADSSHQFFPGINTTTIGTRRPRRSIIGLIYLTRLCESILEAEPLTAKKT